MKLLDYWKCEDHASDEKPTDVAGTHSRGKKR